MLGVAEPGASPERGLQASGILGTAACGLGVIVPPVRPPRHGAAARRGISEGRCVLGLLPGSLSPCC